VNATPAGRTRRRPSATAALGLLALAAGATLPPMPPAVRSELAPTGTLRAGINHGNVLLASRNPASGEVLGIAVDLARELARRAALPLAVVPYESAGTMADAGASGAWDVAVLGAEPERASRIAFSPPYLEIEATYLVPAGSPIRSIADVDRDGVRVAVSAKSAYDLLLGRTLRHARLVRVSGVEPSFELFVADKLDALAVRSPRCSPTRIGCRARGCSTAGSPRFSRRSVPRSRDPPSPRTSASSSSRSKPRASSRRRSSATASAASPSRRRPHADTRARQTAPRRGAVASMPQARRRHATARAMRRSIAGCE
jgi:polar amino acid transport system substrate-binding protein